MQEEAGQKGETPDPSGNLEYVKEPKHHAGKPDLKPAPPYMYNTPPFDDK